MIKLNSGYKETTGIIVNQDIKDKVK